MYKNVGKKIKSLVEIVVFFGIVSAVILGIVFIYTLPPETGVVVGILVAGVGAFIAWLGGLLLYAYGEIADGIQKLSNSASNEMEQTGTGKEEISQIVWEAGTWTCRSCGTENPKVRKYCLKCNVSKEWSVKR